MILLTVRDLLYRKTRFAVVIVLAAIVFALLFVMNGLVAQFEREPYDAVDAFGATAWVVQEGVSGPFTAASTLSTDAVDAVEAGQVAPVVIARSSLVHGDSSEEVIIAGHDPATLGAPPVSEGRAADDSGEIVVDASVGVDVGDAVSVGGAEFVVVGRSNDTTIFAGIPLAFMVTRDAQELVFDSTSVISGVLVTDPVVSTPPGTVVLPADDVAADAFGPIENAVASIDLVRGLLWAIAALIIGAVVYLSALERQRDFAVLKAVGVSNRTLLASLALQAVLVALASVALAAFLQLFLAPAFPLEVRVPTASFWQLPLLAVVASLVAGAAGMRRVANSDPALAFAGAGG